MLFFLSQDVFEDAPGGRILFADVLNDLAVAVDGNALGDQVFIDHFFERVASHVLGVGVFDSRLGLNSGVTDP